MLASLNNPAIKPIVGNIVDMTGQNPTNSLQLWLTNLITVAISIGGLYFFVMLIMGAYSFMTAGGDKDGVQKANAKIRNALVGIALLLSVYTIMWIVSTLFNIPMLTLTIPTI
jgi:hypothetical protein